MINKTNKMPTFFNAQQANRFAQLHLSYRQKEYPTNKTSQVYYSNADFKTLHQVHPTFYGCLDCRSSIQEHWWLITLLKQLI